MNKYIAHAQCRPCEKGGGAGHLTADYRPDRVDANWISSALASSLLIMEYRSRYRETIDRKGESLGASDSAEQGLNAVSV